ncbi:hypothetical protein H4Q26_016310 [Puccinia striiformis f. sp. tritici PST-130]|nr:hypothetical protein H4Q26_016310 [Puccinia striiformis f. sp. tritici PST-130]
MAFLFKSKTKSPQDLIKTIKDSLNKLENNPSVDLTKKINEDITKALQLMKSILTGSTLPTIQDSSIPTSGTNGGEDGPQNSNNGAGGAEDREEEEARSPTLPVHLTTTQAQTLLPKLRQIGTRWPTVDYLANREEIIWIALKGYENSDVALNTGMILKEILRHEILAKSLLYSERFYDFPQYIEQTTFGIACDAMSSFKECLTRHKSMVATYLEDNYEKFFSMYTNLIQSTNYVTKRQSIKLLGEILLDRSNYNVMNQYISNEDNLKIMMNLLKDKSKNIQFEAFHVFKVFVANPRKPAPIESILKRNKDKLIEFLRKFHNDKDDEQFNDEKGFLILQIENLR